ncbi:hypothetical protein ACWATR_11560 [Nostoc sp. UIC 10890]
MFCDNVEATLFYVEIEPFAEVVVPNHQELDLIRKENLKGTQLITRSEFQPIGAVLT